MVGKVMTEAQFDEAAGKKDACYHKVKARYDVWPSAYASGALVKCRKVGAANWGNKSKKEGINEIAPVAVQGLKDSKGQMWDLFWRENPEYVIPFNKSGPKTKVKDIKDMKLKKSVLKILKSLRTESVKKGVNEAKYSVRVDMGRKIGTVSIQVDAKDEKEARELVAKGLKNPKNIKKVVKINNLFILNSKI